MTLSNRLRANFYFGIKPKGIDALVCLDEGHLIISFEQNGQTSDVIWEIDKIHPDAQPDDNLFILSYGQGPSLAYLEFKDANQAITTFKEFYPFKTWQLGTKQQKGKTCLVLSAAVIAIVMFCFAAYFIFVPGLSDRLAKSVPIEWEIDLGNQLSKQLIETEKQDKIKSAQIDSFFRLMDVQTDYPLKFYYLDDTIVNAFAVPGGSIIVYQGLLDKMKNYEALAGLLGHEFTHVQNKHSLRSLFRSLSGFVLLSLLFGDLTGVAGVLLENSHSIQNLSYSREFEEEADEGAVQILLDRKIPLDGMLGLFKIFQSLGAKGLHLPEFLSTHPITDDRIKFVEQKMSQKESETFHHENLDQLFQRIKQISPGEEPK